ncbi:MAG: hypothetical protein US76_04260 [Parcubacteria group bacterium GW2011_GWA2_38_13b]|nr:MAG: hypothetical protein US76_04260 [Parcubacteria group bacterium GW2011_GWA2_38_13b]
MKAIVLDLKEGNPIVEMRDMPVPKIAPDEVLIKVAAVSICGTDCSIYKYTPAMQKRIKKFPHILGHEFAGYIKAIGRNIVKWKIGDYVSAETHIYCGKCPTCEREDKNLCPNLKLLGVDRDGCFAEYIAVPEKVLIRNDISLPPYLASIQEPLGNAVYCVNKAEVRHKDILIIGDGPAALFTAVVAVISKAKSITMLGYNDYRLQIAEKIGVSSINCVKKRVDFMDEFIGKKDGGWFDVVFEMTGSESGINTAINVCRPGGKIMVFGLSENNSVFVPYNKIALKGIMAQGIYGRNIWKTWEIAVFFLNHYRNSVEPIITHKLPFNEWQRGFDLMIKSRDCGKVVLLM